MIRPIITAAALALALGLYFAGILSPGALAAALTFAGLPGADALVQALRQRAGSAPAEVRILGGGQLLDLVALAQRLLAAEHPAVKEAGAQLGELLSLQPAAPAAVRSVPPAPPSLPPALLLLLLPLLALAPSCASWPAWRSALAGCGVQMAPAGVEAGVALALRGGDGWAAALAGLASTYGDCLVKAQVLRHAQGEGPEPPRSQAVAAPLEGLIGGELTASSSQVSKAEAERRAAAWLAGRR